MKKILGIASLVALGFAGSAWASSVGTALPAANTPIAAYNGEFTVARESLGAAYTINLDTAVRTPNGVLGVFNHPVTTIRYVPTFGLNQGDLITFTLTNAKFMDASYVLLAEEDIAGQTFLGAGQDVNNDADQTDVIEVASNFGATDAVNGVAAITVRVNSGLNLPSGIVLVLQAGNGSAENAGGDGLINDTTNNPTVRLNAGLAAGTAIGLSVSAQTQAAVAIPAAAASNSIMDVANQFALAVTAASSTIDVESAPSRSSFVEEGGVGDILTTAADTDLRASAGLLTWTNQRSDLGGTVEDYIVLDAGDGLALTLTTNAAGFTATDPNGIYLDWLNAGTNNATTDNANNQVFTISGTTATVTVTGEKLQGQTTTSDDLVITTNGAVMTTQTVALTGTLTLAGPPAGATYATGLNYTPGNSHVWGINGSQFVVPYLHTTENRGTYVLVNNTSANAAEISVDVTGDALRGPTKTATNVTLGSVPANSTKLISPADINAALLAQAAGFYNSTTRFMGLFTVNAPVQSVFATAFQNEGPTATTKRYIPVLTPDGAGTAWKN